MTRAYTSDPVDPAIVDLALSNATHAPSAGFSQGWAFLVLDSPADVARYWAVTTEGEPDRWLRGMMKAPVIVLPCSSKTAYLERYAEPDKGWTDRDEARWPKPFWDMDAAMASLLILQTATDAGLGACFFGIPPSAGTAVRAAFAIPPEFDPVGAITLGHPAPGGATGSARRRARTPLADVVHRGRFRGSE